MPLVLIIVLIVQAAMTAMNVYMYALHGQAVSLAGAAFCGLMFITCLAMAVSNR